MLIGRAALLIVVAASLCLSQGCRQKKEDTLTKVKRQGVIHWGGDPSGGAPFAFFDPADPDAKKVIGFECDIMEKVAGHMGVRAELVASSWDTLIDNMRSQRSDIVMNGVEINEARKQQVNFSAPYYVYQEQLTVRQGDKDKYKGLDDLKGHKIATLKAAEANNVLKRAGFDDDQIQPMDDSSMPYRELELKRVDGVVQEDIIAAYYATPERSKDLYNVPQTFSEGRYAVAIRKEDAALLAEIDRVLDLMNKNGELAAIYKKWGIWNDRQKTIGVQEAPVAASGPK